MNSPFKFCALHYRNLALGCLACGLIAQEHYSRHSQNPIKIHDTHQSPPEKLTRGWQCPICEAVMSPNSTHCLFCKGKQ